MTEQINTREALKKALDSVLDWRKGCEEDGCQHGIGHQDSGGNDWCACHFYDEPGHEACVGLPDPLPPQTERQVDAILAAFNVTPKGAPAQGDYYEGLEEGIAIGRRPAQGEPTEAQIDRVAEAIAKAADADYWTDEIAEWENAEEWYREAYPDEYPGTAYEDREWFRKQGRAALVVAFKEGTQP